MHALTDDQLRTIEHGMIFSGKTLLPTQMREDLSASALRFEVPDFVIQGRDDLFTPTAPAEAYFAKVVAPHKQIAIIDGAGHFATLIALSLQQSPWSRLRSATRMAQTLGRLRRALASQGG